MIFVTVGTQFAFPRLVNAMAELDVTDDIVAQVGPDAGVYPFETKQFMTGRTFEATAARARVIVAHAGMGSVLTARRLGKPLVIMPRRAALSEHRNDHQMTTARQLEGRGGVDIAWREDALREFLARPWCQPALCHDDNKQQLLARLQDFVTQGSAR